MSEIQRLIELQRQLNAALAEMTPQERAAYGTRCVYEMARAEPEEWAWLVGDLTNGGEGE